jgi:hypothetical protein
MKVVHWRYEDGWRYIPEILRTSTNSNDKEFDSWLTGWHCWCYPDDDDNIEEWMKENMTGYYECDWRFNSGDAMYTVLIKENEDATLFKLRWGCK